MALRGIFSLWALLTMLLLSQAVNANCIAVSFSSRRVMRIRNTCNITLYVEIDNPTGKNVPNSFYLAPGRQYIYRARFSHKTAKRIQIKHQYNDVAHKMDIDRTEKSLLSLGLSAGAYKIIRDVIEGNQSGDLGITLLDGLVGAFVIGNVMEKLKYIDQCKDVYRNGPLRDGLYTNISQATPGYRLLFPAMNRIMLQFSYSLSGSIAPGVVNTQDESLDWNAAGGLPVSAKLTLRVIDQPSVYIFGAYDRLGKQWFHLDGFPEAYQDARIDLAYYGGGLGVYSRANVYLEGGLAWPDEKLTFKTLQAPNGVPIADLKSPLITPFFEFGILFGRRVKGRAAFHVYFNDVEQVDETPDEYVVPLPNGTFGFKVGLAF